MAVCNKVVATNRVYSLAIIVICETTVYGKFGISIVSDTKRGVLSDILGDCGTKQRRRVSCIIHGHIWATDRHTVIMDALSIVAHRYVVSKSQQTPRGYTVWLLDPFNTLYQHSKHCIHGDKLEKNASRQHVNGTFDGDMELSAWMTFSRSNLALFSELIHASVSDGVQSDIYNSLWCWDPVGERFGRGWGSRSNEV